MTTKEYNVWDYNLITEFNVQEYDGVLLPSHICGNEQLISKYKDENGIDGDLNERVFPLKKDGKLYFVPRVWINELPVRPDGEGVVVIARDVYYLLLERIPCGLRPEMKFESIREFVDQFCDYEHSKPKDFFLNKILFLTASIRRVNYKTI